MKDVEHTGFWWLPEQPDNEVPGTLRFTVDEGLRLDLLGTLFEVSEVRASDTRRIPVVLGVTRGKLITLLDCLGYGVSMSVPGYSSERYRANVAFVGGDHFPDPYSIRLNQLLLELDGLAAWSGLSGGRARLVFQDDKAKSYEVHYETPEPVSARTDWGSVAIAADAGYPLGFQREHVITEVAWFAVTNDSSPSLEWWLREVVNPLQDLVTFAIGKAARITDIQVISPDVKREQGAGKAFHPPLVVLFQPRYGGEASPAKSVDREEYVFRLEDVSERFASFINTWLSMAATYSEARSLYFAPTYSKMYQELRFLYSAQALEGYHRACGRFAQGELPRAEHRRRIRSLVEQVAPSQRAWLKEKLAWSNSITFREQLREMVRETGGLTDVLGDESEVAIDEIVKARNRLVHPHSGGGKDRPDGISLYHLATKTRRLFAALWLKELSLPVEWAQRVR